jgi:hypothetical protein
MSNEDDEKTIHQVIDALSERFPDLPHDTVEKAVVVEYQSFADSPVRDYIAVLVQRGARMRLANDSSSLAA